MGAAYEEYVPPPTGYDETRFPDRSGEMYGGDYGGN